MERDTGLREAAVDRVWVSDRPSGPVVEQVIPTGRAQVVVDIETGSGVLVGPRTEPGLVTVPGRAAGVSLTGVGVSAIVGTDVTAIVDRVVPLDAICAGAPSHYPADVGDGAAAMARLVERLLSATRIDPLVAAVEAELRSGRRLRDVVGLVDADRRTLVPQFRKAVGLAPKHYERLCRMQAAVGLLRSGSPGSVAAVAHGLGFADQAHLSREVRRLCGRTPGQLVAAGPGRPNHLPPT